MAGERTPLLTTVSVGFVRRRYPHQTLRRFCSIALGSSLLAVFIVFLVTVVFGTQYDAPDSLAGLGQVTFEQLQTILLETPSTVKASEWSRYYTSGPHLAGKNLSQAQWTRDKWEAWGVSSSIVDYDVYINYPADHRLALLRKPASKQNDLEAWRVDFEATLKEDVLKQDPSTALEDSIPTFHGYSANGNVTAPFVYVNYGTYYDFEDLVQANVSLEGKIAIARYGGVFRGLKVKRAQELGMLGCVLYTDPGDDSVTEENGYETYPNGPARNPSSVQRGSVQFLSISPGDPTTPGYPSKPGVPRQPVDGAIPSIPSIPISYVEAVPILKALNGHGPSAKDFNQYWTKNMGLKNKDVEYNVGPSPDNVALNLYNKQDYVTTPIWNVIGIINGTLSDEVVVVGNHRDAWIAGGAGDPNSGSAVLNEVIRGFGKALEQGWRPLRTIVFASWDGEEYGLVGSTEWVEEYLPWLSAANVAYINTDVSVRSPHFKASAAPLLHQLIYNVTGSVLSPNQTVEGQTVRDVWDGRISPMGSGSDFTAFMDHAGIPSIDFGFGGEGEKSPIYHYHSNYDSYHWMSTFGDPGFVYHRTMAQVLALATARMATMPLLPLNATDYATAIKGYVQRIETKLDKWNFDFHRDNTSSEVLISRLYNATEKMRDAAVDLDSKATSLSEKANVDLPWWRWISRLRLLYQIWETNRQYKLVEKAFLYSPGLDGRPWFKHVVFAPGLWTGYSGAVFPGLVESIEAKDYNNMEKWVSIVENSIEKAAQVMR